MLPASNISLSAIQTIMGGENPISLGEYYNAIGALSQGVSGIASSGLIGMASFASKAKNLSFGTPVRSASPQSYTTAGTFSYTIPTSGYYMIESIGGGGGGGNQYNGWVAGGGGGGGGFACGIRWFDSGSILNITVGAGGAGGASISPDVHRDGTAGGASFVTLGGVELVRGNGGGPGLGETGTAGGAGGTASASATMGGVRIFIGGPGAAAYLVVYAFHNGGGGGSAGNFFGSGVAGVANTTNAIGGSAQIGYLTTGRGGNGAYYNASAGISSANEAGQGIGAGSGGGHDIGAFAGSPGAVRISQVFYYGNNSVKTVFQPKFWLRAQDLTSLAHLAEISSWTSYESSAVATGQKAGTMTTLPIFHKTTETWPFVRMNTTTGGDLTAGGSFFNLGSHTMNMGTGGGWTLVVAFRFTAACTFGRIIDFGDGQNNNNILAYRIGSGTQLGISYRNGSTQSDNTMTSTITGGWQVAAFKYTGTSAVYFASTSQTGNIYDVSRAATTVPVQNKTISTCYIGRSHWPNDSFANLDLRELLFFDSAIDDGRILELMANLNSKFPTIVTNGLILHIDPTSYRSGNTIYSVDPFNNTVPCILSGSFAYQSAVAGGSIRLSNTSGDMYANVSHLQLSTLSNVRSINIWYFIHSAPATRYLIDARNGASNGWIYNGSFGGLWTQFFINGGAIQNAADALLNVLVTQTGVWRNVTLISNVDVTDDITLFARFSQNEGLDVTFGVITVYNRVISESENTSLFNLTRGRYGV